MKIEFKQADTTDAELLVEIYNASFYNDYMKYGECPACGKTKEAMEKSIINYPKFLILCDGSPVGCVSCKKIEERGYEIGCLCVIPEFQGKGIGTRAIEFVKSFYKDWDKFTLITPIDKSENIKFYTKKCGFDIVSTERDGNVEFQQLKLEVFQIMVENYGVRSFALEADYGCCETANRYIHGGEGTAAQAASALGFQIYQTDEMSHMLSWMRAYNENVSVGEDLCIYGFDMQRYDADYEYFIEMAEVLGADTAELKKIWNNGTFNEDYTDEQRVEIIKGVKEALLENEKLWQIRWGKTLIL